jgi:predicted metal-dependent peptidase
MTTENEFCTLSAQEMLSAYADKSFSPVDVMEAHLKRAERANPDINALFSLRAESALKQARASQDRWVRNAPQGREPLRMRHQLHESRKPAELSSQKQQCQILVCWRLESVPNLELYAIHGIPKLTLVGLAQDQVRRSQLA